ncbi:MAG: T9SS type A sorting domain-containing protein [Flavobacteriales bacterium]|nr:T9SS type A sorting domain-containing protein [Flavobacteriales bacterium]
MKKILLAILTLTTLGASAQLPSGSQFEFEFTGGSLTNTSVSGANNLSGSVTAVTDRFGSTSNAIDPTGVLNGPATGTPNILESTLCFWMKHSSQTSGERILQMYGAGGNGYRIEYDQANKLYVNLQIDNPLNTQTPGGGFSRIDNVVIDDNNWHHIAIRTSAYGANGIEIEVFVDNVLQTIAVNPTFDIGVPITEFINNANFVVSPTNNYTGDIDDIYFYKTALTNAEIGQIYNYSTAPPCTVNIPDANFKAYLVGNTAINTGGDPNEIECSEAAAFTGLINCSSLSIADLTGIEAFVNLSSFKCTYNASLTNFDLSANVNLTSLNIYDAPLLTSIDLSSNTQITNLRIESCYNLTSMNISSCTLVDTLNLGASTGFDFNFGVFPNLKWLNCYWMYPSSGTFDFSNNPALEVLYASFNGNMSALDLTANVNLTHLDLGRCNFTTADYSYLINLEVFGIRENILTSLNVANGNNTNLTLFDATDNPNLTCIQVDDATYSTTNWTNIDATSSFSTNCGTVGVNEITQNLELTTYPNPTTGKVTFSTTEQINSIEIHNLTGQKVTTFNNTNTIDISNLTKGVYFAKIIAGTSKPIMQKIIKE